MGMCATTLPPHCTVGWGSKDGECFECDTFQYFGHCVSACPSGTEAVRIVADLCVNLTSSATRDDPVRLYVREDTRVAAIREGPLFFRFIDALASAWETFTVIFLIGSEVTFDTAMADPVQNIDYITSWAFPDLVASGRWTELSIKSLPCSIEMRPGCVEGLTTLFLRRVSKMSIYNRRLIISDVIITTRSYFFFDTVKECPVFGNEDESSSFALRGCAQFSDLTLFAVGDGGSLTLDVSATQHVRFVDITVRFKSVISVSTGIVRLLSSHFENVQTVAAVITSECLTRVELCGSVSYDGGTVSHLNNARELGPGFGGFLQAHVLRSVHIIAVEFRFCFASDALLSLIDFTELELSDCTFRSNVVFGPLLRIDFLFVTATFPLQFAKLKFIANYSKEPLFKLALSNTPRNITIIDSLFEGNAGDSALHATFTGELISPNSIEISTTSFLSNSAFHEVLKVQNFAIVTVSATEFRGNGGHHDEANVFEQYLGDPNTQASTLPAPSHASCDGLVVLLMCASSRFDNLTITENRCDTGGTGIVLQGAQQLVMITAMFARNVGSGAAGTALRLSEGTRAEVYNFTAQDNTNSVIFIPAAAELHIFDSLFQRNTGVDKICISARSPLNVTVLRCIFEENTAIIGDGAAIGFVLGRSQFPLLYLEVRDSTFSGNHAVHGSAISVLAEVTNVDVTVVLINLVFLSNRASLAGASLYVDSDTGLYVSIERCEFANEQSERGAVSIQNVRGSVVISQSVFKFNAGRECSALCLDHGPLVAVLLEDVEFIGNINATIAKMRRQITSSVQTIRCFFMSSQTAMSLQNTLWQDSFSIFRSSSSTAVSLTSSLATLVGSKFDNNESPAAGGAVILSNSKLQCTACLFEANVAMTLGGAIYLEQQSSLGLLSSSFRGNTAGGKGAALYAISSDITANSSDFLENIAGESGTLAAVGSGIILERSSFASNSAPRTSGLLLTLSSIASVANCLFRNQTGLEAAFFLLETSSSAAVSTCTFSHGSGWMAGAAFVSHSSISIFDSNFTDMEAQVAGVIYAISSGNVSLLQVSASKVHSYQGGIVHIRGGKLAIKNSHFSEYGEGAVNAEEVESLEVLQSSFEHGQGDEGSAVHCVKCSGVTIAETRYTSNRGLYGTVFLQSTLDSSLVESVFIGNTGKYGGAVFARSTNLRITACSFLENTALSGGALNLACLASCEYVVAQSVFARNTAAEFGGAIQWSGTPPVFSTLTFRFNAAQVGADISSFLAKVHLFATDGDTYVSVVHEVGPGELGAVTLVAELYDHYGQLLALDNSTTCKVRVINETMATLAGTTTVTAARGFVTFADLIVYAEPKSIVVIEVQECSGVSIIYSSYVEVRLRGCRPGESASGRVCLPCGNNSYSFDPSMPCQSCPAHYTCLGNTTVVPKSGYWRISENSLAIRKCRYSSACLDGAEQALNGVCAAGYEGRMCQVCSAGYYSTGNFRCFECPSAAIAQGVLVIVAALLAISALVWASVHAQHIAAFLSILVTYFHTLYFVAEVDAEWPVPVEELLEGLRRVAAPFHTAVPVDCWVSASYYSRLIALAVLPGVLALVVGALWLPVFIATRTFPLFSKYLSKAVMVIYFFVYPTLVTFALSVFSCTELEAGEYWLAFDTQSRCWTTKHCIYLAVVGVGSLLLLVVPLLRHEGLLVHGLLSQRKHWEAVVQLRKFAMAAVVAFLAEKPMVQALALQATLWFALVGQFVVWPYATEVLNRLEFLSLLTSALTMWCGILYFSTDSASWFVQIAVIGSISLFPVFWLRELRSTLKSRETSLESLIASMDTPAKALQCASMKKAYMEILSNGIGSVPSVSVLRSDLIASQASSKVQPALKRNK